MYYTSNNNFAGFAASTVAGGSTNGDLVGGVGTAVFIDSSKPGSDLYVYQPFTFSPDTTATFGAITVSNGAPLTIGGNVSLTLTGALTITGNSTVYVQSKNNTGMVGGVWAGEGSTIQAASIQVDSGSSINADGQGYSGGLINPGKGPGGASGANVGGSYGGAGGGNPTSSIYGSQLHPVDLGSSGAFWCKRRRRCGRISLYLRPDHCRQRHLHCQRGRRCQRRRRRQSGRLLQDQ